jgi:hypothetical protein
LTAEDLKNAQPEDYIRLFSQYLGMLQGYYVRYIQRGNIDFVRDNVAFQMFPLYLSETETQEFAKALNAAILPYLKNESSPERKRSIFGLIALPDAVSAPLPAAASTNTSKNEE